MIGMVRTVSIGAIFVVAAACGEDGAEPVTTGGGGASAGAATGGASGSGGAGGATDAGQGGDAGGDAAVGGADAGAEPCDVTGNHPVNVLTVKIDGVFMNGKHPRWQRDTQGPITYETVTAADESNAGAAVGASFTPAVGSYSCTDSNFESALAMLFYQFNGTTFSATYLNTPPASCSVIVTSYGAVGEPITGTFEGVLYDDAEAVTHAFTEGTFSVVRCE